MTYNVRVMSVAIYIVAEGDAGEEETSVDGKALGHVEPDVLDAIARGLGCTPLYDFMIFDSDDIAEFVDDIDELDLPPERWFDSKDGLQTVRSLKAHLEANPADVADAAEVIEDLDDFERVLALLVARGSGFRLAMDA